MPVPYIKVNSKGKSQIMKAEALSFLRKGQLPLNDETYKGILSELDQAILGYDSKITKQALSNAHGDWYEWMLAAEAWNFCSLTPGADLPILLPNISQFDVARLYKDDYFTLIEDLRQKVLSASTVQLITSNPDFVIIDRELVNKVIGDLSQFTAFTPNDLSALNTMYVKFANQCDFEDIIGYISIKASFRPDRRLQIPHEGSLMKALYVHMQTREWIINPPGLKYYAMATSVSDADRNALKTVATHSITTVSSIPQPAVDEVFSVNSTQQAKAVFSEILVR